MGVRGVFSFATCLSPVPSALSNPTLLLALSAPSMCTSAFSLKGTVSGGDRKGEGRRRLESGFVLFTRTVSLCSFSLGKVKLKAPYKLLIALGPWPCTSPSKGILSLRLLDWELLDYGITLH